MGQPLHDGPMALSIRLATVADLPALREVMDAAISQLQQGFLTPEQIESSRTIMGLDTQLGAGSRASELIPTAVVGRAYIGASFVGGDAPQRGRDRLSIEC